MAGIYFHIPFCKRICAYCDFYRSASLARMDDLVAALHRELEDRSDWLRGEAVRTRYFGGGTPSLLAPAQIRALLDHAGELFDCSSVAETTLEANPDDLTPAYLDTLLAAGIDRLSIGVQSFDDACLLWMNRRHTAAEAVEAVRNARRAGFGNITVDLIFGVPGFGGDSLRRTLCQTLELGVQHISAYHLTVEPRTTLGRRAARGEFAPVDEAVSEEEFLTVHRTLTGAGFEHYEVSNYALPGFRARHNAAYWHGASYLGLGPAAHSYDGGRVRSWNVASLEQYLAGAPAETETLSDRDRFNEYLMTRLRTAEGVVLAEVEHLFGRERLARLLHDAKSSVCAHTLRTEDGRLAIPPERFLVSDAVIEALFET
ncbi:radical SAM family heme chaperone HemW [Alistipes sp.]|uniref:radical SAM family heme chaperone HemW n=1 Tax=Alistipes sp. TaxID=1872444 RepID=UPI003AF02626